MTHRCSSDVENTLSSSFQKGKSQMGFQSLMKYIKIIFKQIHFKTILKKNKKQWRIHSVEHFNFRLINFADVDNPYCNITSQLLSTL